MSTNEFSPALEEAISLLRNGEPIQAEDRMLRAVKETEDEFGKGSAEFAFSQYELGSLLAFMDRLDDAVTAMRRACAVNIPDDRQATRDRLTYLMTLGEILERKNALHDAEEVLRDGLVAREQFYGREHPGYAFGLEPLASVVFRQGDSAAALAMVEETIDNFWQNGHPRVASAFPLRAEILKTTDADTPAFDGLAELPDAILADMAAQTLDRVAKIAPEIAQAMLDDLLPLISDRLGEHHEATINIQVTLANLGRDLGSCEGRIETIEKVLASHEARGDQASVVQTRLALALALSEAGDLEGSVRVYEEAVEQARALGDSRLRAQALRNLGLFYSEHDRDVEAEQTLRLAVGAARESRNDEMLGRCMTALGIFLQHHGDLEHAEPLLVEAVDRLDSSHTDCLCARSHLQAIQTNASCGCGDMGGAISAAFRSYVLKHLPEGVIDDLQVELVNGEFQVHVRMEREPNPDEMERVDRIIQQAQIEFRKRLAEGSD